VQRELPRWVGAAATAAAVALLVALSAWRRWVFLAESPHPLGIDGYFYAVELRSLLETGQLAYPVSPVGLWLLAPFAALTDPITGAKLGASLLGALVAVPAYLVGKRLGGTRATGLLAAALATPSAGSFYLSVEFVKNGIGITVALTYVWALLRALESPTKARVAIAAGALLATIGTHKMAAGLAIAITVPAIAVEVHARRADWRRLLAAGAATLAGLVAITALLSAVFPGRFLGPRELALAEELFTADAEWRIPALVGRARDLWIGHEAAIGGVLGLAALAVVPLVRNPDVRPSARAVTLALAVLSVVIALPWLAVEDPQGLGFRLRIAAFAPMALVGAALVGAALARTPQDIKLGGVIAFAAIWAFAQPARRDEGVIRAHPAMVASMVALGAEDIPEDAVLVCPERHLVFMAAWYTRHDVRLRPERVAPEKRWRLVPLAFVGKGSPLDDALLRARAEPGLSPPRTLHPRAANGLVLVPDATWLWALDQLPEPARSRFRKWRTI
jgi:4-amino-4-deoxy-L-arabinose transferase-like glycosyltransferase